MSEKITIETAVHKAQIPLKKGEAIEEYINELSKSCKEHIFKKLNLSEDSGYWLIETFADKAIFSVHSYPDPDFYVSVEYKRNSKGDFSFGDFEEVERIISFEPVKQEALDVSKCFGGWVKSKKSFWKNVI